MCPAHILPKDFPFSSHRPPLSSTLLRSRLTLIDIHGEKYEWWQKRSKCALLRLGLIVLNYYSCLTIFRWINWMNILARTNVRARFMKICAAIANYCRRSRRGFVFVEFCLNSHKSGKKLTMRGDFQTQ